MFTPAFPPTFVWKKKPQPKDEADFYRMVMKMADKAASMGVYLLYDTEFNRFSVSGRMSYEAGISFETLSRYAYFADLPEREHTQVLLAWTPKDQNIEWTENRINDLEQWSIDLYNEFPEEDVSLNAELVRLAYPLS